MFHASIPKMAIVYSYLPAATIAMYASCLLSRASCVVRSRVSRTVCRRASASDSSSRWIRCNCARTPSTAMGAGIRLACISEKSTKERLGGRYQHTTTGACTQRRETGLDSVKGAHIVVGMLWPPRTAPAIHAAVTCVWSAVQDMRLRRHACFSRVPRVLWGVMVIVRTAAARSRGSRPETNHHRR